MCHGSEEKTTKGKGVAVEPEKNLSSIDFFYTDLDPTMSTQSNEEFSITQREAAENLILLSDGLEKLKKLVHRPKQQSHSIILLLSQYIYASWAGVAHVRVLCQ